MLHLKKCYILTTPFYADVMCMSRDFTSSVCWSAVRVFHPPFLHELCSSYNLKGYIFKLN